VKYQGYVGKYLRLNLSTGEMTPVELDPAWCEQWLGGNGWGAHVLFSEVPVEVDPLSPDNKLIFATGPICGTLMPNSGRVECCAKSPLTGSYGDANAGGFFGPELKFAGWDMLIIEGRAPEPVYLWIEDQRVEVLDAATLWGRDTIEVERLLRRRHQDDDIKVACIGPAGEKLVRYACIQVTPQRSLGRSGMGAVMGSKNLKAIAVRGHGVVPIAQPERFYKVAVRCHEGIRNNPVYPAVSRYGTPGIVSLMNQIGRFPTRNFQAGHFDRADAINAEALRQRHFVKDTACYACPIGCDKIYAVREGEFKGTVVRSLEYETLGALGASIDNADLPAIIKANDLADRLGLDTISAGRALSFAYELWEKGIITAADTGGLDLAWGNWRSALRLIELIARREGFGDLLAEGVKRAAAAIGKGSERYAMHVKGQEIAAQDGRAQQSMGLAHVTATRGADHLKAFPTIDETGYPDEARRRYGEKYLPEMADPQATKYKGFLVKDGEDFGAVIDSAGNCKSGGTFVLAQIYWEDMAEAISAATGMEVTVERLQALGERIYNLQRVYNVLHGISRRDDTLPERFLTEPSPSMSARGHVCRLEPMLEEYYACRQWDPETGYPTGAKLMELGLVEACRRLEAVGKLK
jgi:aldehyde:ferredoxin oxidoreductase